jgi:NAD(P)-dependent dehydrogenase (short-subunit alcohol dehydrogenase family)
MTGRMNNKVALVTGGAKGIGEAVCRRYAEEGATVVVTDIDVAGASQVAESIVAAGGKAVSKEQDVTSESRWDEVMSEIVAEFGGLDVLVNNAGIAKVCDVEDETLEGWRQMQAINGESVYLGTQKAIQIMKGKGGSIINMSSIMGLVADPVEAAYNYSKGGVRLFSKSAALHCAEKDYNIRVNSVHPGYIETPLITGAVASLSEDEANALLGRLLANIPMKKMGKPDDIAHACVFLGSDESTYITGSELVVDGGYTCK